jgi:hypothetical protein
LGAAKYISMEEFDCAALVKELAEYLGAADLSQDLK